MGNIIILKDYKGFTITLRLSLMKIVAIQEVIVEAVKGVGIKKVKDLQ